MDEQEARELVRMTSAFYATVSASFSATRQAPWQGWEQVLACCGVAGAECDSSVGCRNRAEGTGGREEDLVARELRVMDLACGNLRFERFLHERTPRLAVWAQDNCDALASGDALPSVRFQHLDVMETLFCGQSLAASIDAPADCDLCVSFGFLHHVPLPRQREEVLAALLAHTRPGGHVAVSLWQFGRDARIMAKARPLANKGDYLLGWQGRTDVARYCHDFSEDEVSALAAAVREQAREVARFSADGKSGDLNRYLVLQRI